MPTQGCTLFTSASSQRLRVASGASMVSAAGQALMWGGWFKFATLPSGAHLIAKGDWSAGTAAANEYFMLYHGGVPGVQGSISNGTALVSSGYTNTPAIATGVWVFILCWYDPATGKVTTQINNNATTASATAAGGIAPNTALNFTLGASQANANCFNGRMNSVFAIQRATAPTTLEARWLYNQGYGRIAADLGVAGTNGQFLLPAAGKGDWWDLADNNANHAGAVNGIVLVAPGGAASPTFDGTDSIARYTGAPGPDTLSFGYSGAYFSGSWSGSNIVNQATIAAPGVDSTAEFTATGSALTANVSVVSNGGGEAEASVDDGAFFNLVPSAYGTFNATAPIFSGLSDTPHKVIIRARVASFFRFAPGNGVGTDLTAGIFNVTGNSPDCQPPATPTWPTTLATAGNYLLGTATNGVTGQVGANGKIQLESGYALTNDAGQGYNPIPKPSTYALGSDASNPQFIYGGQIRFRATTTRIDIWAKHDGAAYALIIDGVIPAARTLTSTDLRWGWVTIGTGLDGGAEHTYGIINSASNLTYASLGDSEVWAIRTPGGTFNTTAAPTARLPINFFGDSITGGQAPLTAGPAGTDELDAALGWAPRTAERLGYQWYNAGIGSTTVHDYTGQTGTLAAGVNGVDDVTVWSGEARASHDVVSATPTAPIVVVEYGVNDVAVAWYDPAGQAPGSGTQPETTTQFGTSFTNMINTINGGLPAADVYVLGIMPLRVDHYHDGASETTRQAFNAKIQAVLTAIGNAKNHYLDLDHMGINGPPGDTTGTDFVLTTLDGLHPGRFTRGMIHEAIHNAITGTKTLGIVPARVTNPLQAPPYPSQAYTLRVAGIGGTGFVASHALTASAGTLGSPTVSSDTYLTIPWTAPASAQRVTITDTGSGATTYLDVVVPTLSISPTSAVAGSPVTLTLTAPFTAWASTMNATLFTSPGVNLTGASVSQFGTASVTFTPAAAGPLVITDTSTGQTATLTVAAPPGWGHFHPSQLTLQPLTGSY